MSSKETNPKDQVGSNKLPLHLWPAAATALGSVGMLNGLLKYGRANFREAGIRPTIYLDAAQRHLSAWLEGEELDPDDGVPHLGAALACIGIIVDARVAGAFVDDRNFNGGNYREFVNNLTSLVPALKEHHAGRDPKHFTISDNG